MKTQKEIWVADSETDPFEYGTVPEPFIWGVYNGSEYHEFVGTGPAYTCTYDDLKKIADFFREKDVIVYAHNGGKFDWHFLSPFFEPDSEMLIIHGRLSRFEIGLCEFRDSYNLMPVALEQYNKMEFDYTKMYREHRARHMQEIKTYLKSDCVNLWNMIDGFNETYGLHITQASAAMYYWRKTLNNPVPRSGPSHYEEFKPYYYGGRVQCFEQGDFKLHAVSVDINSAYPYAMLSPHPYSLQFHEIEGESLKPMSKWGPMFFSLQCVAHGCFPYRGLNGSLYFPDDDIPRIYDITGWELIAAIETGTIEEIIILKHYDFYETKDFSQYVNHFWNLRQEFKAKGDKGGEFYCKIFLNALYGKFASDPRRHKNYTLRKGSELESIIAELKEGDSFQHFREWLIVSEEKTGSGKGRFYNLATSASITGHVRAMLWRAICHADRPLYCDTDSITAIGFGDGVTLSNELGDWGIEYEYDRAVICGKKLYAMHQKGKPFDIKKSWKIASKGARLDHKEIIRIANGERVHFKNAAPTFSASKSNPTFVDRHIQSTASDIRKVPKHVDPIYADD